MTLTEPGQTMFILPAILDLTEVVALRNTLQAALSRGEGLEIDASQVARVTSPCLQVLAAAVRGFAQAGGPSLRLTNPSPAFSETARVLDLDSVLGGAAHV